jgi:hypothetical protein
VSYLFNLLVAVDQLFNVLAGGNPDVTISGRIGWHCKNSESVFWHTLRMVVDNTFAPLDGEQHCYTTLLEDSDVDTLSTNVFGKIGVSIFVVVGCAVLFIPVRVLYIINRLRPL